RQLSPFFGVLRRSQLLALLNMSDVLGVPLSPVGLVTFTSGVKVELVSILYSGDSVSALGTHIESAKFKKELLRRTGLWVVNSFSASRHQSEWLKETPEDKLFTEDGKRFNWPYQQFPPTREDVEEIHSAVYHEGYHVSLNQFRPRNPNDFGEKLLSEGLAARANWLGSNVSISKICEVLLEHPSYLSRYAEPEKKSLVNRVISIAYESKDPEYQGEITWRSFVCRSLSDFLDPCEDTKLLAKNMLKFSREDVLPRFRQKLL
ncbi:MAG: hypothetical protein M1514_01045, partial [Patescibacteria group bacterium]|nr:hypothetical protein [Patescibacteria group bacterium]